MKELKAEEGASVNYENVEKRDNLKTIGLYLWKIVNLINHAIILAITIFTWYLALKGDVVLFNFHVTLSTTGYQLLMAEGILSISGENVWSLLMTKQTKKTVHWVLAGTGSILAIAGTSIIIYQKGTHFKSNHGILGLVAMIFVLISVINGPMALFFRKINIKPAIVKLFHYFCSSCAFLFGMVCLILGYDKNWFKQKTSPELVTCFVVFSSITIFITLKIPIMNMYRLVKGLVR